MIYYVYILASKRNGTLYIGMTNNIGRRVYEHRVSMKDGFTKKYKVDKLVYIEKFSEPEQAIAYEKKLKKWNRKWKLDLIESKNPMWIDYYEEL